MSGTSSAKIISNFFLSMVLDGLMLNSGYIFYAIKKEWRWEGSVAIIPLNVNKAISGILGAIFIMKTFSKDSTSIILWGSLLCATGIGLSSITKDITWLIVFWGTVFGTGYGITSTYLQKELTTPGRETVQKIFLKCAPNVGGVFLPFVLEQLFDQYDLTGSCLIVCGIILNYIPLSLLAFYNIGPKWRWNEFKWPIRKRSSKYEVSNQASISVVQSLKQTDSYRKKVLASCLEPDIVISKLSVDNGAFENDYGKPISINSMDKERNSLVLDMKESALNVPDIIENSDMEALEKQIKSFPNGKKLSKFILDIEKYENDHKIFEEDFYAKGTSVNNDSSHVVSSLNESSNAESLTFDEGEKNLDCDSEEASNTEIVNNDTRSNKRSSTNCPSSVSTLSQSNVNETPLTSVKNIEQFSPEMFKINVLECTFESESDYMHQISKPAGKSLKKNNYRHHSNSLITQCYDDIDFSKASAKNKELFGKNHDHSKQVESIYNVYDKDEIAYNIPKRTNAFAAEQYQNQQTDIFHKLKEILKSLKLLANWECLLVFLTTITAEYIMTVLTVLICSFAEETGVKVSHFKWIIAAFGVGLILGKYCFYYINGILKPRISITSAILFMLNSLAIIGVLWSSSLKWYINFYSIIGILQGCIQASFTKIKEDYICKESNLFLSTACKLLFGIIILSLPHLIQFTTSFTGDFELLLEIISCCSALCAIFCFSLQKCSTCCFVK
ncbi:uncharacterized protein LOC129224554 [Uloborus diversus]|uniref:uncharacterized protein LOC129224554 n=1 Tax=Uloborus diversus TaxID=327109 RepID=UPI002409D71B|nr:uncharacterized protein LOC129224554 [Uloborus diversus]